MIRSRRRFVCAAAGAALAPIAAAAVSAVVEVWTSPQCGCCNAWVRHLQANGFATKVSHGGNDAARARLGMPLQFGSCHTALAGGYAIEGHVPAREIRRLLDERPADAIGLAVPAMPLGSPGMDGPEYGSRRDPYDVLLIRRDGTAITYQAYR